MVSLAHSLLASLVVSVVLLETLAVAQGSVTSMILTSPQPRHSHRSGVTSSHINPLTPEKDINHLQKPVRLAGAKDNTPEVREWSPATLFPQAISKDMRTMAANSLCNTRLRNHQLVVMVDMIRRTKETMVLMTKVLGKAAEDSGEEAEETLPGR